MADTVIDSVVVRDPTDADMPCVLSNWLRSLRHGCSDARRIRSSLYFDVQRSRIARMLASGARLSVAAYEPGPELIMGWACGETGVLHYVYVKKRYRGNGIARMLVEHACGEGPLRYTQRMDRIVVPVGWEYEGR